MLDSLKVAEKFSEEDLLDPFKYLKEIGAAKLRSRLSKALNKWMKISNDKLEEIDKIIDSLHVSSLILDDLQALAPTRNGRPSAHVVFGYSITLNASTYMIFETLDHVENLHQNATEIYTDAMLDFLGSQGTEVYWKENWQCPTEDDYYNTANGKTGNMLLIGYKLMALFSDNKEDYVDIIKKFGLFCQIYSDYVYLKYEESERDAFFCEDATEGRFALPVIHAIRSQPKDKKMLYLLKGKESDKPSVRLMRQNLMAELGSFDHTRDKLIELREEILAQIEKFGSNSDFAEIVMEFKF